MEIIVPAAGLSTRFPDLPPKYLLKDTDGYLMLDNALMPYYNRGDIHVGILKEHIEKFDADKEIAHISHKWMGVMLGSNLYRGVVVLPERTKGPADTVYQICKVIDGIKDDGPMLIKDCDSFFDHDFVKGNYVCTTSIPEHETLHRLSSKSFVQTNDQGLITDIIEKKVVSETFCVGGYKFAKRSEFMAAYEAVKDHAEEVFVSHVIQYMISQGKQFFTRPVTNYTDVGTLEEWKKYIEENA